MFPAFLAGTSGRVAICSPSHYWAVLYFLGPASTSFRSQTHFRKRGKGPVDTSFTSQTHFCKRGKGLVNCIYKPCPTGMQWARWWCNQISMKTVDLVGHDSILPWWKLTVARPCLSANGIACVTGLKLYVKLSINILTGRVSHHPFNTLNTSSPFNLGLSFIQ